MKPGISQRLPHRAGDAQVLLPAVPVEDPVGVDAGLHPLLDPVEHLLDVGAGRGHRQPALDDPLQLELAGAEVVGARLVLRRQEADELAAGVPEPPADGGQDAAQLDRLGGVDGQQHRHRRLGLRLEQVDEAVALLDRVHHLDDHLGAGVRGPRLDPLALGEVAAQPAEALVVAEVPGVDLVAVDEEDPPAADAAEKAAAVGGEEDPAAGRRRAARQVLEKPLGDPGQRQLEVVVAEGDDELAAGGAGEALKGGKDRLEGRVAGDPVELRGRAVGIEASRRVLGQEVDEVVVDHQGDRALLRLLPQVVDEPGQGRAEVEHLGALTAAEVEVGDGVDFVVAVDRVHARHVARSSPGSSDRPRR